MLTLTVPVGVTWDALRMPLDRGLELHRRLYEDPDLERQLGSIVTSDSSRATYWLITTGSTAADWPEDCRLLTRGSHLLLPGDHVNRYAARWLHLLDAGQPSGAVWLAAALHDHYTLTEARA